MRIYFKLLLALVAISPLNAQTSLTLPQAVETALSNHFGIAIEKINLEVAQNSNHIGETGALPRIAFNLVQSNSFTDVVNPASFLQGTTLRNNINPTVTLDWLLFDGFRAKTTHQRLQKLQSETQANLEIVVQNTVQSAILAFYRALLEKERLNLFRKTLELSRLRFLYLRDRKEMGVATTSDVLTLESAYLSDSVTFLNQQLTYKNALVDLQWSLNAKEVVEPLGSLELPAQNLVLSDMIAASMASNANLKKEYITLELAQNGVELAHADLAPRIATTLNYSFDRARQDISNASLPPNSRAEPVNFANVNSGAINFTVSQTLYNGGRIHRAIENAKLRQKAQDLRFDQLKTNVVRELNLEFNTYQSRNQIFLTAQKSSQVAAANLEIAKQRFETGLIGSLDYLIVQNNFSNAEFAKLNSAYLALLSFVNLQRLTGGILDLK
jgi:outer membrane protein TolC